MRDNLNKVQERGENLNDLQGKTDNLAVSAGQFRRGANRVRKQMWWKVRPEMCFQKEPRVLFFTNTCDSPLFPISGHEDANFDYCWYYYSPLDHHLCVWQIQPLSKPEVSHTFSLLVLSSVPIVFKTTWATLLSVFCPLVSLFPVLSPYQSLEADIAVCFFFLFSCS